MLKYLSICSGIEAATVAWHPLGWEPVGFSEIEPFPSAVLAHHYPHVTNFGDMTKFQEWNINESVDLLVGGTPCQSFSVAGLRKGLADPRGNLMLTYLAIAAKHKPKWLVWENVPGVLSSNGGRDFAAFLRGLEEFGYGWSYRVLDAQYFGVAQRRRRVFVVGHLGNWQPAAAVLFERQSLSGNPAPSRETRKEIAKCLTSRAGNGGFDLETETPVVGFRDDVTCKALEELQPTLTRNMDKQLQGVTVMATLNASDGDKWGSNQWVDEGKAIVQPSYGIPGNWIGRKPENGGNVVEPMHDIAPCLTKTDRHGVAQPMMVNISDGQPKLADVCATLDVWSAGGRGSSQQQAVLNNMAVRRLTPMECERLQGFPDNYTNISYRNKPESPDGPRYKALGNSMAVPVMRWIGERINQVKEMI